MRRPVLSFRAQGSFGRSHSVSSPCSLRWGEDRTGPTPHALSLCCELRCLRLERRINHGELRSDHTPKPARDGHRSDRGLPSINRGSEPRGPTSSQPPKCAPSPSGTLGGGGSKGGTDSSRIRSGRACGDASNGWCRRGRPRRSTPARRLTRQTNP